MAAKPVILVVDDDADVLRLIKSDLRRQYGHEYRILSADSGALALDALRELSERGEPVALLVVDQRMPGMGGVDFLEQAITLYPDCKRILLTAYADTEAAIKAINKVKTDYYLLKPWDPPEEQLYPVLTDLLDDGQLAEKVASVTQADTSSKPGCIQVAFRLPRRHVQDESQYQVLVIGRNGQPLNGVSASQSYPEIEGKEAVIVYSVKAGSTPDGKRIFPQIQAF